MNRMVLTDGRWFDIDAATAFHASSTHDGFAHISDVTNTQWEDETLYYTPSGHWVIEAWSARPGTRTTYTEVDAAAAARWLVACGS